jgi:pSer/pThr/pTyr-binding forkhead associated (FHA) protein
MAIHEKLEIIKDSGEIFFYAIEPHREYIKFGSHPDNDIVVSSPGISPYHAMLDLRSSPYQFVELNEIVETNVGDQILSPSTAREIHTEDTIELGNYRITLIEDDLVGNQETPERPEIQKKTSGPGQTLARTGETGLIPPSGLAVRPPDQIDDAIITEPVVPEFTIDAGQTLTLVFYINGGRNGCRFQREPGWPGPGG